MSFSGKATSAFHNFPSHSPFHALNSTPHKLWSGLFRSHWSPISNQQSMLVTSFFSLFKKAKNRMKSVLLNFEPVWVVHLSLSFFFFFCLFSSPVVSVWRLIGRGVRWVAVHQLPPPLWHQSQKLWKASVRGGRLGGLEHMRRCQEGVWMPAKELQKHIFFFL